MLWPSTTLYLGVYSVHSQWTTTFLFSFFSPHYGFILDFCRIEKNITFKPNVFARHSESYRTRPTAQTNHNHLNFLKHYVWSLLRGKPTNSNDELSWFPPLWVQTARWNVVWSELMRTLFELAWKVKQSSDRGRRTNRQDAKDAYGGAEVGLVCRVSGDKTLEGAHNQKTEQRQDWWASSQGSAQVQ